MSAEQIEISADEFDARYPLRTNHLNLERIKVMQCETTLIDSQQSIVMPDRLRVLVACEFSGTVREAFLARGHDAWSCDLLPDERGSNRHITGDVRDILNDGWDLLMVAHPPCTRLCNSGVRWLTVPPKGKTIEQIMYELDEGASLFSHLWNAPIPRICVENPIMHRHAKERIRNYRPPTQTIQPWQFGHGETKATCLWLKGLKKLRPTNIVDGRTPRVHYMSPGPDRWKERSRTYPGIAEAMATQWGEPDSNTISQFELAV
jgi:hypothetical protein